MLGILPNRQKKYLKHHHDQSDAVLRMMIEYGLDEVAFELDLQGIKRFAVGRKSQGRFN